VNGLCNLPKNWVNCYVLVQKKRHTLKVVLANMLFINTIVLPWFMEARAWGFFAHKDINSSAIYLLPPPLINYFIKHQGKIVELSVSADQRRRLDPREAPRHFMDMDAWSDSDRLALRNMSWSEITNCYDMSNLEEHGVLPWNLIAVYRRLIYAFENHKHYDIVKLAADLGHYASDACVPLHLCSNYNGQKTGQHGIHALFESRIPEYLQYEKRCVWRRSQWIPDINQRIWSVIDSSFAFVKLVLSCEFEARKLVPNHLQYAPILRNKSLTKQESIQFVRAYYDCLGGLPFLLWARSIEFVADLWFSAWVNAGQPNLMDSYKIKNRTETYNEDPYKELVFQEFSSDSSVQGERFIQCDP